MTQIAGGVTQVVEHLASKHNDKFKPQHHPKKEKEINITLSVPSFGVQVKSEKKP
jgi:hypothetical protein